MRQPRRPEREQRRDAAGVGHRRGGDGVVARARQRVNVRRPGDAAPIPLEPGLLPARFPPDWGSLDYRFWDFQLPRDPRWRDHGFPAWKLGSALQFLLGEALA